MAWIGNTPSQQQFVPAVDYFSGNGSTTAFTLSRPVASVLEVEAVIENVPQKPSDAYTISGNTITFTSAPPAGTSNIYVRYTSPITQVVAPSQDSVGTTQLMNGAVTAAKMANSGFEFGMRNRIINGAMMIDQRNAGASVTPTVDGTYTLDRWQFELSAASKFSVQKSSTAPAGFSSSILITSLSAYAVLSGSYFRQVQVIEGFNVADLGWGTANAQTVTLSFWVRSSLTGTFGGALNNYAQNRSYPFTYTISSANTWEQKSVTIAGDTSGTWNTDSSGGIKVSLGLGVGSTYSGTAGAWAGATYLSATGATSVVGTSGATFYITGVQLEKGSTATSFDYRPYGTELALCQRYYIGVSGQIAYGYCGGTTDSFRQLIYTFPVQMRVGPTVTNITWSGGSGAGYQFVNSTSVNFYVNSGDTTTARYLASYSASAEL